MAFSFGTPNPKSASGFTLPTTSTITSTASTTGFQFGASGDVKQTAQEKPAGLGLFGAPGTQSAGFSLAGAPAKTTPASTGLNFGVTPSTAAGISFGAPAPAAAPQFSLGSNVAAQPIASTAPLSFGLAATTSVPSTSFGLTAASSAPSFPLPSLTQTSQAAPSTSISFKLPTSTAAPASSAGSLFGAPSLATTTTTATTSSAALSFGLTSTTVSTAVTPAVSSFSSTLPQTTTTLTFAQLEDAINKWTIDLEEQGKLFANQAKQLNAWDRLLISNGEKILNLSSGIDRVKQQQQQLDQALDFILAQQKELEGLILPLEIELAELPVVDQDRSRMYQLAEGMDSQLKQMSEDLKEIIEHINESNKTEEASDPIAQIGKILNAHMNSLQWIDRNTSQISNHLDQILKMQDLNRRNNSFNY